MGSSLANMMIDVVVVVVAVERRNGYSYIREDKGRFLIALCR